MTASVGGSIVVGDSREMGNFNGNFKRVLPYYGLGLGGSLRYYGGQLGTRTTTYNLILI